MILLVLPDPAEDDARLTLARQGNAEAIVKIYHVYFDPVYQFCRLRVGDMQTAEDLASEVFVKFIKALKHDKGPHTSLRGWIFRVARNVIADHYGKQPELPTVTLEQWLADGDIANDPEWQTIQSMDIERVRQAISMLSVAQQEVLMLRFDQQLSLRETADIMDKEINAVKALQFRALGTLRHILLDIQPEEE